MTAPPHTWIESYRFWDVVDLWARELLQHPVNIARTMATGVLQQALRISSVDEKWLAPGEFALHGAPYIGFVGKAGTLPIIIRASALTHLRAIAQAATEPDRQALHEEFITRQDFATWLLHTGQSLPQFWFHQGYFSNGLDTI